MNTTIFIHTVSVAHDCEAARGSRYANQQGSLVNPLDYSHVLTAEAAPKGKKLTCSECAAVVRMPAIRHFNA